MKLFEILLQFTFVQWMHRVRFLMFRMLFSCFVFILSIPLNSFSCLSFYTKYLWVSKLSTSIWKAEKNNKYGILNIGGPLFLRNYMLHFYPTTTCKKHSGKSAQNDRQTWEEWFFLADEQICMFDSHSVYHEAQYASLWYNMIIAETVPLELAR